MGYVTCTHLLSLTRLPFFVGGFLRGAKAFSFGIVLIVHLNDPFLEKAIIGLVIVTAQSWHFQPSTKLNMIYVASLCPQDQFLRREL